MPDIGRTVPEMVLNRVVFPAPLGPTIAANSPAFIRIVMPFRTGTPPYPALNASISSIGDPPALAHIGIDHGGILRDVRGLPLGQHGTLVEHDEAMDQPHHGLHGVFDDDDRDAL